MAESWPLPTNKVAGNSGFVTDINQLAENVNALNTSRVKRSGDTLTGALYLQITSRLLSATSTTAPADGGRWDHYLSDTEYTIAPITDAGVAVNVGFRIARDGSYFRVGDMRYYSGTGTPNGVVSAPVGAMFRNTESGGYNGARVWRKNSGSGNTGWVVTEGDTGWRDVTSGLLNGWAPTTAGSALLLRRVGQSVTLRVGGSSTGTIFPLTGAAATDPTLTTLPAGFLPKGGTFATGAACSGSSTLAMLRCSAAGNVVTLGPSYASLTSLVGELSTVTDEAWPSSLPGTAA